MTNIVAGVRGNPPAASGESVPRPKRRSRRVVDPVARGVEGYLTVTRTRYGSEPEELVNETIQVREFPTSPAYVSVRAKETVNTGDYNSVSVEVSLSLPTLPEDTEIERTYNKAASTCERWLCSHIAHEVSRTAGTRWEGPNNGR